MVPSTRSTECTRYTIAQAFRHGCALDEIGNLQACNRTEKMWYGVPVVASRQDAGQEVNVHGVTGYNVNLDAQEDLSEALVTLLTEPDKAHAMGAAGRERWCRNFTYSGFKTRFLDLLANENLLSVPRADRT